MTKPALVIHVPHASTFMPGEAAMVIAPVSRLREDVERFEEDSREPMALAKEFETSRLRALYTPGSESAATCTPIPS